MPDLPRQAIARERFDEFFNRSLDAHAEAEAKTGYSLRRRFRVANIDVEFRIAHPSLEAPFCKALAHIEFAARGAPDFVFHIRDELSSGVGSPPPCWDQAELFAHGEVASSIDSERYLQVGPGFAMLTAANRHMRKAVVLLRSLDDLAPWRRHLPLITLLNWLASGSGYYSVHAGAVGRLEGGVLIVGPSGAGKSHTAMACLDSDLLYVADDRCLLGTSGQPACASLYSTARLYATDIHRFPILQRNAKSALRTEEGKLLFSLNSILPDRLGLGFPIKAIVLPQPSGRRDTKFEPAPAGQALLHLASDNIFRWPSGGRACLAGLASVLRTVPCFRLETGTNMSQIPETIAALLDSLPKGQTPQSS